MSPARFPHSIPVGWFMLVYSDALQPGEVRSIERFGRALVLFRTASGEPSLFDAHCPHLGAHLGHGGHVEGEHLRCPFHGWAFDVDGECVDVPYAQRIPAAARARAWPVAEHSGRIWAWHGAPAREPFFEVSPIEEETDPDWTTLARHAWEIRSCVEELSENGADAAHFRFVHDMREVPEMAPRFEGATLASHTETVFPRPAGRSVPGEISVRSTGLGCDVMHYSTSGRATIDATTPKPASHAGDSRAELVEVVCTTPIDAERVHVQMSFRARREGQPDTAETLRGMADYLVRQFEKDVPIWENKRYRAEPALCDGDGPIAEFRRWARQFD